MVQYSTESGKCKVALQKPVHRSQHSEKRSTVALVWTLEEYLTGVETSTGLPCKGRTWSLKSASERAMILKDLASKGANSIVLRGRPSC